MEWLVVKIGHHEILKGDIVHSILQTNLNFETIEERLVMTAECYIYQNIWAYCKKKRASVGRKGKLGNK